MDRAHCGWTRFHALRGAQVIPAAWCRRLERHDQLVELADRLHAVAS